MPSALTNYITRRRSLTLIFGLLILVGSCRKKDHDDCHTPVQAEVQGVWEQDYVRDMTAFQPRPDWEELKLTKDSFYARLLIRSELLKEEDCYEYSWLEYQKGTYSIKNDKIYFDGIYTDSNYVEKTSDCHQNGPFKGYLAIALCGDRLKLNVLDVAHNDVPIEGWQYTMNMYRK